MVETWGWSLKWYSDLIGIIGIVLSGPDLVGRIGD